MLESSSIQSVWKAEVRYCNNKWRGPFTWVCVFYLSCLSCQYSFFMLIIYTTLAAGRVLFALTEKSTWVLITHITFLFLPINKTNHALMLLSCHQGEVHFCSRTSMSVFPFVPVSICSSWPWQILKMEYCFFRKIAKLSWPIVY